MKKVQRTKDAPEAIGPYSQAVIAGRFLFASGQIALRPDTGELVEGGIEAETRAVMKNLLAVLQSAGLGFEHVVKTTVYLVDLEDFARMNEIYAEYMGDDAPARATVEVRRLPKGARVEIDLVAHVDE